MKDQATHIQETIQNLKGQLSLLPPQFAKLARATETQIDALIENAGIMDEVTKLRDNLTASQKKVQTQADFIQGKIKALEELHYQYHYAPVPEGVTHMSGIELEPLDPETRLRVMGGDAEADGWLDTIKLLGGNPDRKDWDGSEEEEEEEPTPKRLVPPSPVYDEDEDFGSEDDDPNLEAIRNMMQK